MTQHVATLSRLRLLCRVNLMVLYINQNIIFEKLLNVVKSLTCVWPRYDVAKYPDVKFTEPFSPANQTTSLSYVLPIKC